MQGGPRCPRSRATRVARPPRVDMPQGVADWGVGEGWMPPAQVLAGGAACGHRVGDPLPYDLQLQGARAAITVRTIEPIGVEVSTSLPPRFSTHNPAPLPRSASAKAGMFGVGRPSFGLGRPTRWGRGSSMTRRASGVPGPPQPARPSCGKDLPCEPPPLCPCADSCCWPAGPPPQPENPSAGLDPRGGARLADGHRGHAEV